MRNRSHGCGLGLWGSWCIIWMSVYSKIKYFCSLVALWGLASEFSVPLRCSFAFSSCNAVMRLLYLQHCSQVSSMQSRVPVVILSIFSIKAGYNNYLGFLLETVSFSLNESFIMKATHRCTTIKNNVDAPPNASTSSLCSCEADLPCIKSV